MARSISQIQAQIKAEKATHSELDKIDLNSLASVENLWIYITAVCISVLEQLLDVFKVDIETIASNAIPATPTWIVKMLKYWQYGDNIELDSNLAFYYPIVNTTKNIITRVSVFTTANKTVQIKVAKGTTPTAISGAEKTSLSTYLGEILPAGVGFNLISIAGDSIEIGANIYVNGQYIDTIKTTIITALDAYLANLSFDGKVKVSAIQDTIQSIEGVNDVVLTTVNVRNTNQAYGLGTSLVADSKVLIKDYTPLAGYIIQEVTASHTFNDTLIVI
jgi:hypothetical protein